MRYYFAEISRFSPDFIEKNTNSVRMAIQDRRLTLQRWQRFRVLNEGTCIRIAERDSNVIFGSASGLRDDGSGIGEPESTTAASQAIGFNAL